MKSLASSVAATVGVLLAAAGSFSPCTVRAADLSIPSIFGVAAFEPVDGVGAFGFGFWHCNVGSPAPWISNSVEHPVTVANLYRLEEGRFEQIGMSWALHEFCALQIAFCGSCQAAPGSCTVLGTGCATSHSAAAAAIQSIMGPRSQVDPIAGPLAWPFQAPLVATTVDRRLQVPLADLDPAQHGSAQYFVELITIAGSELVEGGLPVWLDNASHRRVVSTPGAGGPVLSLDGPTMVGAAALESWAANGGGAGVPDPLVSVVATDLDGDDGAPARGGRLLLGTRVAETAPGTWSYEYAVMNLSVARAAGAVCVPLPAGVEPTAIGQHFVPHHSGEPYASEPWTVAVGAGPACDDRSPGAAALRWSTAPYEVDPNANALRWGTLHNFRFQCDRAPVPGSVVIELFEPVPAGVAGSVSVAALVPGPGAVASADLDGDGTVDGADLGILLAAWGACRGCPADLDGDGAVDGADLGMLLAGWEN